MIEFEFHPLADLFPLLEGVDFDNLVKDIKNTGQAFPITIYQGMILMGATGTAHVGSWNENQKLKSTQEPSRLNS